MPSKATVLVLLSRWRIEVGFLLGTVAIGIAHPTRVSIAASLPMVAAALALRVWARGHLERRHHLTQTGPYALVRHPLYIGNFLLGLAFALMTRVPLLPLGFMMVFAAAYLPKALREEAFLRDRYGDAYTRYAASVGAMLPRLRGRRVPSAPVERFAWERVFRHREQRTWMGVAVVLVAMWARAGGFPTAPIVKLVGGE